MAGSYNLTQKLQTLFSKEDFQNSIKMLLLCGHFLTDILKIRRFKVHNTINRGIDKTL